LGESDSVTADSRTSAAGSVVLGNVYNKYESRNPIARWLLRGYLRHLAGLCERLAPASVLEVGCGEGYLTRTLGDWWPQARIVGIDLSPELFDPSQGATGRTRFLAQSAYELGFAPARFDLVVGAEVLEHLDDPERALDEIARVARGHVILSVPREPLWRVLNMVRFSYLADWGNTPGHLQHWSASAFLELVASRFEILEVRGPLPWTMVLAKKKAARGE
jgi:ubiquinone/menaquinone biosynthesis C-methylase UbiE